MNIAYLFKFDGRCKNRNVNLCCLPQRMISRKIVIPVMKLDEEEHSGSR